VEAMPGQLVRSPHHFEGRAPPYPIPCNEQHPGTCESNLDEHVLLLHHRSNGGDDGFLSSAPKCNGPVQPLRVSVEVLSNLIYPARRTETHSEGDQYLDWAARVIEELQHHPKLRD
jgi:hypothetical protein